MKQTVCDRCGANADTDWVHVQKDFRFLVIGDAKEFDLCSACGRELDTWVRAGRAARV